MLNTVPIVWALMTNRRKVDYVTLFHHLDTTFPNLKPISVSCDFELAMRAAILEVWLLAIIIGCYFRYSQVGIILFQRI